MIDNFDFSALLLLLLGFAGGWLFMRQPGSLSDLTRVQDNIRKRAQTEAAKSVKSAEKTHQQVIEQTEKAEKAIEASDLEQLSKMVNEHFDN